LGFLSGLKEVCLEHINHYLASIVDKFLELWKDWRIPKTYQYSVGLNVKVALIIGSSDTPVIQKLSRHSSAIMKCHRCEKHSTYSEKYKKTHYGGMHNSLHRQYAYEWLQSSSEMYILKNMV
jgi:hypothetical protein